MIATESEMGKGGLRRVKGGPTVIDSFELGLSKDPSAWCPLSQQNKAKFGSEVKETVFFDQRMERCKFALKSTSSL